jgi:D-3-phosphoglycerate dehydrogenase
VNFQAALAETSPHLLVVRSTKVPAAAISASKDLELVVRAGAGVDNIDIAAAAIAKVKVANCAGANADAVAELAMGLILACDRRIVAQDTLSKQSSWAKGLYGDGRSKGLKGRVLGIVGFGRIGRQVILFTQYILGGGRVTYAQRDHIQLIIYKYSIYNAQH